MVYWCYILATALGALVVLYGLLEIHYFLRMCLCVILARYIKKKSHIRDTTQVTGICLTNDIDTLLYHMNNARYLREIDFARVDFYERTRLYKTIISKGGGVVQGATTIRYRRFIRPFTRFRLTSKITYWDGQSVFMEHRFISPKDNFIHCIAICRQRIINCSVDEVMSQLLGGNSAQKSNGAEYQSPTNISSQCVENGDFMTKTKPEMPIEIVKWMEYNEISSKKLRNDC